MASESNSVSDEKIAEALIREVIEEELKHIPSEDVPSLTLPAVELKNEQEEKFVDQLGTLVCKIGEKLKDDVEIQADIDELAQNFDRGNFNKSANKVFEHGITWEKIVGFFYVPGQLAVRMVEAHLSQSVMEILKWTVDFFKQYLLGWIRERGGWICSFSELAMASMQTASSMSSHRGDLVIIFFAGIALGFFISWRLTR
ncbi:apoptosis regulator BAX-like [Limanda limanda]|uniref:apoptosis regulator BAX-like n=1 Tax=Limanda limanda TaxID=27771 RepID=UPI0029C8E2E2|nr:apoptosis regulator BAX-like [Limanda limanda]